MNINVSLDYKTALKTNIQNRFRRKRPLVIPFIKRKPGTEDYLEKWNREIEERFQWLLRKPD